MKKLTQYLNESMNWPVIRNYAAAFFIFVASHEFKKPVNAEDRKIARKLFYNGIDLARGPISNIEDHIDEVIESPELYDYVSELTHDIDCYESKDCLVDLMTDLCEYVNDNIL